MTGKLFATPWQVSPVPRRTRIGLATLVVLIHLGALWILTHPPHRHMPRDTEPTALSMTMVNLHATAITVRQPSMALPPAKNRAAPHAVSPAADLIAALPDLRLDTEPVPLPDGAPPSAVQTLASALPADGTLCDLVPFLKTALETDSDVNAALHKIPASARSVANAIMLWNGSWVSLGQLGGDNGVAAIRTTLVNAVRAAPPACLLQPQHGPKLIPVADNSGTVVFAVGSGVWLWGDILPETVP